MPRLDQASHPLEAWTRIIHWYSNGATPVGCAVYVPVSPSANVGFPSIPTPGADPATTLTECMASPGWSLRPIHVALSWNGFPEDTVTLKPPPTGTQSPQRHG